ncbi:hypothetical protein F5Y16DRAFT_402179 [Xylariaceae sp. FL0255]|nr:hypothetical protein F5Y16DRAFT_402179 [Xylariaceae sp. FL0255]
MSAKVAKPPTTATGKTSATIKPTTSATAPPKTITINPNLKKLDATKMWVRNDLQTPTHQMLDLFRLRVATNSIRYDFDVCAHGSKAATHTTSVRIDLCAGTNESTGHNQILFPHAQITHVTRTGGAGNVSMTKMSAYELRDSEVMDMMEHTACPNGVLLWMYAQLQTTGEFDGVQIVLKPTKARHVGNKEKPMKIAMVPADILSNTWPATKRVVIV